MAVSHFTDDDFDKAIAEKKTMVVDFWAPWCGPCKVIGPIFEELSNSFSNKIVFAKMNVDEQQRVASANGITSIPTLLFYKEGKKIDTLIGAVPKPMLESKIKTVFGI